MSQTRYHANAAVCVILAVIVMAPGCVSTVATRIAHCKRLLRGSDRAPSKGLHIATQKAGDEVVAILTSNRQLVDLRTEELVVLAEGYNYAGNSKKQLEISNLILGRSPLHPRGLDLKDNAIHNIHGGPGVQFGLTNDRSAALLFFNECIRKNVPDIHLWYMKKAQALCESAVLFGNPGPAQLKENERATAALIEEIYHCIETSIQALGNSNRTTSLDTAVVQLLDWMRPGFFPVLESQRRFKTMKHQLEQQASGWYFTESEDGAPFQPSPARDSLKAAPEE